jgi:ABC-type antimicrobial peptide transport system permease subunit
MKFISYLFKDLFIKVIKEKRIVFIMCFSLSITIAISFVLIKGLLVQLGDVNEIDESKKSYSVVTQCNIDDSRCILTLDNIINDSILPEVTGTSDIIVNSVSSNYEVQAISQYNSETAFESNSIIKGNWFSDKDINDGNMVVICNEDFLNKYYPNSEIGDSIRLFNFSFTISGIVAPYDDSVENMYIPYKALTEICEKCNNDMRIISTLNIDFAEELSAAQKTELIDVVNKNVHQTDEIKSRYDMSFSGNVLDCILYIGLICIMFMFCIINVINLFRYFALSNLYEYSILKICGSSNLFIMILMYIQSVIIAGFSYGIGLIIYFISLPAQETFGLTIELNFIFYLLIFLLVFILITLSYIPTIKKISTVSPVDKRLWR